MESIGPYQDKLCVQPDKCCSTVPCMETNTRTIIEDKLRAARERVAKFEALLKLSALAEPGTPLYDALAETARWTT